MENTKLVGYFEIPEELARSLSEKLIIQQIKMDVLTAVVNEPDKYNKVEADLVPILSDIRAIRAKITRDYVPEQYRSAEYIWNYDGYEVDGCKVQVHTYVCE